MKSGISNSEQRTGSQQYSKHCLEIFRDPQAVSMIFQPRKANPKFELKKIQISFSGKLGWPGKGHITRISLTFFFWVSQIYAELLNQYFLNIIRCTQNTSHYPWYAKIYHATSNVSLFIILEHKKWGFRRKIKEFNLLDTEDCSILNINNSTSYIIRYSWSVLGACR